MSLVKPYSSVAGPMKFVNLPRRGSLAKRPSHNNIRPIPRPFTQDSFKNWIQRSLETRFNLGDRADEFCDRFFAAGSIFEDMDDLGTFVDDLCSDVSDDEKMSYVYQGQVNWSDSLAVFYKDMSPHLIRRIARHRRLGHPVFAFAGCGPAGSLWGTVSELFEASCRHPEALIVGIDPNAQPTTRMTRAQLEWMRGRVALVAEEILPALLNHDCVSNAFERMYLLFPHSDFFIPKNYDGMDYVSEIIDWLATGASLCIISNEDRVIDLYKQFFDLAAEHAHISITPLAESNDPELERVARSSFHFDTMIRRGGTIDEVRVLQVQT